MNKFFLQPRRMGREQPSPVDKPRTSPILARHHLLLRMRARLLAVLLVSIPAAVLACSGGGPESIVYTLTGAGTPNVFKVHPTEQAPTALTSDSGQAPAWSPNGQEIAFLSNRNGTAALWIMDSEGESERLLKDHSGPVTQFEWAPDSRRIAYEVEQDGRGWIAVVDVDSGETTSLTAESEDVQLGGWSPDGEWVAYAVLDGPVQGIHRKNPRGVNEIRVTDGPDTSPAWSPDGRWIAFNRDEQGNPDIFIVNRDGENLINLTANEADDSEFDWSPDSRWIAFVSQRDGNPEVYVVSSDGRNTSRLTNNRVVDRQPRWSRDGGRILFTSDNDGNFDLYTMNRDGSEQRRITHTDMDATEGNW